MEYKYVVEKNLPVEKFYYVFSEVVLNENGVYMMVYPSVVQTDGNGVTWEQYQKTQKEVYGRDLMLITEAQADERQRQYCEHLKGECKEISTERWNDMLEILPPCRWRTVGNVELFHISERTFANMVSWFGKVQIDNGEFRCFEVTDESTVDISVIKERFLAMSKENVPECSN